MNTNTRFEHDEDELRAKIASVPEWFHQIELAPGIATPGRDNSVAKLRYLGLPEDLTGKRVLDIGANDGFFSFECERRGAEVVAIDDVSTAGFRVAHQVFGSRVIFQKMNIYDLNPEALGYFDLVLCLGVLYHLRHPLLGLERAYGVCRDRLILETQICDHHFIGANLVPWKLADIAPMLSTVPIVQFYPGAEFNGDSTSWWAPNLLALHGMLASVGFMPEQTIQYDTRAIVHCLRSEQPANREWFSLGYDQSPNDASLDEYSVVRSRTSVVQQPNGGRPEQNDAISVESLTSPKQQIFHSQQLLVELLARAVTLQTQQTLQLQQVLAQRDAQNADLEARARWLEEQSRAAHQALAAVEQGRALRLLRWIGRKNPH